MNERWHSSVTRVQLIRCCIVSSLVFVGAQDKAPGRLVLVAPTWSRRLELLRDGASTWREGILSFYVVNGTEERAIEPPVGVDPAKEMWRAA